MAILVNVFQCALDIINSNILLLEHIGTVSCPCQRTSVTSGALIDFDHGGHGCGYANRKEDDTAVHCSGETEL